MKIWGVQEVAQTQEHLKTKHFLNKADTNLNFPNVFYLHPYRSCTEPPPLLNSTEAKAESSSHNPEFIQTSIITQSII